MCVFVLFERGPRLTSVFGLVCCVLRLEAGTEGSACSHTDVHCGVRGDHSSGSCYRGFSHALLIYVCNGSEAPESEHILSPIPTVTSPSFYAHILIALPHNTIFLCMSFHRIYGNTHISPFSQVELKIYSSSSNI